MIPAQAVRHTRLHLARVERLVELRLAAGGLDAERAPGDEDAGLAAIASELRALEAALQEPPPLALLIERFALSQIEVDTLVLVAAMELSERCARLVAALRGGSRHGFVDPQIALALFSASPIEDVFRLDAGAILFRAGLLRAIPVEGFAPYRAATCLVPEPHLIAFLAGRRDLGRDLAAVGERVVSDVAPAELPGLEEVVELLARTFRGFLRLPRGGALEQATERQGLERALVVDLGGPAGTGRRMAVRAAACLARRAVIELDGALLAGHEGWAERLAHAFAQAELYGEILHVRHGDALFRRAPAAPAVLSDLARHHHLICVVSHSDPLPSDGFDDVIVLRVRTPTTPSDTTAGEIWSASAPPGIPFDDPAAAARLATRAALSPRRIRQAVRLATMWSTEAAEGRLGSLSVETVSEAVALQRELGLGELTSAESPQMMGKAAELVLSDKNRGEIAGITRACANRARVMRQWGFDRVLRRGTGIICLFDGPPGTGKTLSAEVIARQLRLELHQINVARIVDKYIGETEKNLEQVFARIVPDRTLLLFDEADSLFGTRVKVSTSTDRYANMAINTLLQLIERYSGVVVLTTNLKDAIDPAFERRITYKVVFDKPDAEARERLWRAHLPPEAPLAADIDLEALAWDFELSGGNIKNAVLRAALDCAHGGELTQAALYAQAVREASSMGLVVRRSAFD